MTRPSDRRETWAERLVRDPAGFLTEHAGLALFAIWVIAMVLIGGGYLIHDLTH